MIKLNNKNITYVALADTNNSLKAPKEIWYADSANSVKLVYRRKDALIEGEDYEKYHWLVGDADAYINTLKYYRPYDDSVQMTFRDNLYPNRVNKYNKYNQEEQIWGACESNNLQSVLIRSYVSGGEVSGGGTNRFCNNIINGSTSESAVSWGTYAIPTYINESPEHSLYISSVNDEDKYYFTYNGNTKSNLPTRYTLPELVQQDVRIFYSGTHDNGYFNGSFFNFIHYRNNVEITHLIPCKLLKPVPKWIDANGIRRQVGECGMIDLVSGKFYGNVNSNGTFTVENYYEKKEWLVGDGSAYISGITYNLWDNHLVSQVYNINKKYSQFIQSDINRNDRNISMTRNDIYLQIIFRESSQTNKNHIADLNPNDFSGAIDLDYYISDSNFNVKVNGVTYTNATSVYATESKWKSFNGLLIYSEMMSYIREITPSGIYVSNLIPCTLTMDLPASMDANNIARTKGTSGMWDLVSDRFYGNVANSGTFKAVNLAEGVDYEVHDKLIVEDGRCALPLNSEVFECTIENLSNNNNVIILQASSRYTYHYKSNEDNTSSALTCWDLTQNTDVVGKYHLNNPSTFISDGTTFKCNGSNVTKYGFPPDSIDIRSSHSFKISISAITVDGIERYIPVKLLRSIPSKYDANGIARNAGECGMYDTANDLFYGNVASSGTFSVSDNE